LSQVDQSMHQLYEGQPPFSGLLCSAWAK
jgi:hypothetical protein